MARIMAIENSVCYLVQAIHCKADRKHGESYYIRDKLVDGIRVQCWEKEKTKMKSKWNHHWLCVLGQLI